MTGHRRAGFSLIEVLLATAILMGAIAVLGELVRLGHRSAKQTRAEVTAQLLCESKLAEITTGIAPAEEVAETPFEQPLGWLYAVMVTPLEQPGLVAVEVTVKEDLPEERRPTEYKLTRWVHRPVADEGQEPTDAALDSWSPGSFSSGPAWE